MVTEVCLTIGNIIPISYWLALEAPVSIISICLPSIFSFVKRGIQSGPYSLLTSRDEASSHITEQRNTAATYDGEQNELYGRGNSVDRPYGDGEANQYSATAFKSPSSASSQTAQEEIPIEAIRVQKDLDVSSRV